MFIPVTGSRPEQVGQLIRESAERLEAIETAGIDPLLDRLGDARVVLLGEASHGTAEFYQMRARITAELIRHHGFNLVAVEADWPDARWIDHFVRHATTAPDGERPFLRFPVWMWRNAEFAGFAEWLWKPNEAVSDPARRVAFYGLDLYSLHRSIDAVQNARLVANAEKYYRLMYHGSVASWNLRDGHMFDTLMALLRFHDPGARAVVWEHNSHIGDADATEMGRQGELNLGRLCREEFGVAARLVGFGTDHGTVAAAHNWGDPMRVMTVRPDHQESYERLCHLAGVPAFVLSLGAGARPAVREELEPARLERAIGVIYRPATELDSHYFEASLPGQFDEYVWFDATGAVTPLPGVPRPGLPDTWPFGI